MKSEREYENQKTSYENKLERLDYGTVKRKKNELITKFDKLDKSMSENKGRLSEMEISIRGLEKELDSDK
jgi:mevalonate kinase